MELLKHTSAEVMFLNSISKKAEAHLEKLAGEKYSDVDSAQNGPVDDDMQQEIEKARARVGSDSEPDSDDCEMEDFGCQDGVAVAVNEFLEQYEQSADADGVSDDLTDLARKATLHNVAESNAEYDDGDEQWAEIQKQDTLEAARDRLERQIASQAINSGKKITGKELFNVAQSELAAP